MTVQDLPAVNAALNSLSAVLLGGGYLAIKSNRGGPAGGAVLLHKTLMLSAFAVSSAFLACYLLYHFHAGSVRFQGRGLWRPLYFTILISHTALAALNVPLILRTLYLAWRGRFEEHRRIARWTLPSWLYVCVTGVVVYVMLYRLPLGGPAASPGAPAAAPGAGLP